MSLRIPEGALRLYANGRAEVSHVELASDFWPHWLAVAKDNVNIAKVHNEAALIAHHQKDGDTKGRELEAEFRAALSSISAQAFAVDALYAAVKERLPGDALINIGSDDAARHQYVAETL